MRSDSAVTRKREKESARRADLPKAFLLMLLMVLVPSARAQFGDLFAAKKTNDVTIDKVEFGFGGLVPVEQWTPMTVWLTGGPKGFSGLMIVEYAQDATQAARIVAPAAATPGVSAPVQVTVCLPANLDTVSITLIDQNEKGRAWQKLSRSTLVSGSANEAALEYESCEDQALVGVLLPASTLGALRVKNPISSARPQWYGYGGSTPVRREYRGAAVDPDVMPTNWSAYAGLAALVVPTESLRGANTAAIKAVRTWVSGGGRLVLLVPAAGDNWRRWLGDESSRLIELDESSRHDTPVELSEAVKLSVVGIPARPEGYAPGRFTGTPPKADEDPNAPEPSLDRPPGFDPKPAAKVAGRAVRLTKAGVAEGWRVRWPVKVGENSQLAGLIGEGPVGLGWVTVIGVEPQMTAEVSSAPVNSSVWAEALRFAVRMPDNRAQGNSASNFWQQTQSGPDHASRAALQQILDSLSTVPPIGNGVFIGIFACLVVMALLVGPFDGLVLKKLKLQHFSWLTALVWIVIASLGAFLAPSLLRSAETQVNRVSITDVVMDAPRSPKRRGPAWVSGVTGIFAGSRGDFAIGSVNDAAWWRGISATVQFERLKPRGFPPIQTVQRLGLIASEPGNVPESLWLGQWTFRTAADDGPSETRVGAVLSLNAETWEATVTNLPIGGVIESAYLVLASQVLKFDVATGVTDPNGRWSGSAASSAVLSRNDPLKAVTLTDVTKSALRGDTASLTTGLAGAAGRSCSMAQRIASGEWAMLALIVTGGPSEPDVGRDAQYGHTRVFRVLVPLQAEQRVEAVELQAPALPEYPRVAAKVVRVPKRLGLPNSLSESLTEPASGETPNAVDEEPTPTEPEAKPVGDEPSLEESSDDAVESVEETSLPIPKTERLP